MRTFAGGRCVFAAVQLLGTCAAQTITFTKTHSICSIPSYVFGGGGGTVTVNTTTTLTTSPTSSVGGQGQGQSSVSLSVSPSPSSTARSIDAAINQGAPFALQVKISPTTSGRRKVKRQDDTSEASINMVASWIMSNGNTTIDPSKAAVFRLTSNGQLLADGLDISTGPEVNFAAFAGQASDSVGPITTTFTINNGTITWFYPTFDNGVARLFRNPPGQADNAEIVALFRGSPSPAWDTLSLGAKLLAIPSSSTAAPTATNADQTAGSPANTVTTSTTTTSTPTAAPTPLVSENGNCGPMWGNQTCLGSGFGDCCDQDGFCGSDNNYCGAGCQPAYGTCTSPTAGGTATTRASPATPLSTVVSTDGTCGPNQPGMFNCFGSGRGNCCSAFGLCGDDEFSCSAFCLSGYGRCANDVSPASSSSTTTTSTTIAALSSPVASTSASLAVRPSGRSTSAQIPSGSTVILSMPMVSTTITLSSSSHATSTMSSQISSKMSSNQASSKATSSVSTSGVPSSSVIASSNIVSSVVSGTRSATTSTSRSTTTIMSTSTSSSMNAVVATSSSKSSSSASNVGGGSLPQSSSSPAPMGQSSSTLTTAAVVMSSVASSAASSSTSAAVQANYGSSKRGLVYVPQFKQDDQIWVSNPSTQNPTISWYYNYKYTPSAAYVNNPHIQYVPQLWGNFNNNFTATVVQMLQQGINVSHVLGFNEPDGTFATGGSQVNATVAAARWIQDIEPLKAYGVKLGAPAVTSTETGYRWLVDFFTACNGRCSASFLPLHWYGSFAGLADQIGRMHSTYPNMTIWYTEFAYAHQDLTTSNNTAVQDFAYLDKLPYIDRYSYFGSFRSNVSNVGSNATMLDQCGQITDIGAQYMMIPLQGVIPQSTPCSSSATSGASTVMMMSSTSVATSTTSSSVAATTSSKVASASPSSSMVSSAKSSVSSSVSMSPSMTSSTTTSPAAAQTSFSCTNTALHLPVATPVTNMACVTSTQDDNFGTVRLPFSMQFFGSSSNVVNPGTNGLFTLGAGSSRFANTDFPVQSFTSAYLAELFPLWGDQSIDATDPSTPQQGIWYYSNTTYFMCEWYISVASDETLVSQFSLAYDANVPGVVTFRYYQTYNQGQSELIGVQGPGGQSNPPFARFSYRTASVNAGTQVVCNTNAGSVGCSSSTFT